MNLIRKYYTLTKPGIIYGNLIAVIAGFLLASKTNINWEIFIGIVLGTTLVIASACSFNNYIDREIDRKMARTKIRSFASGNISKTAALVYATILGVCGGVTLFLYTNSLTALLGISGFIVYVFLYGISKRKTIYGTLIGSISGAIPPLAGYTSVTNKIDTAGILLFLALFFWQMPHFYSIAIYRFNDYKNAGLSVWPVKKGIQSTKIQIIVYLIAFSIPTILLYTLGYVGHLYILFMGILSLWWIILGIQGFYTKNYSVWARKVFLFSLLVLLTFCLTVSINSLIFI